MNWTDESIVSGLARIGRMLAAALLAAAAVAGPAAAQPAASRQFAVTLNVEGEYVRTTLALRLPYKTYAQPARVLATTQPLDADEQVFLRFVDAVRSNDSKSLASVFIVLPPAPRTEGVAVEPRTLEQTLAIYRQSFGGFQDMQVEGRVPLDDGVLFIWTAATPKGRMVRGTVVRTVDGRRVSMEVTMDHPIETFIVNTLNRLSAEELAGAKSPAPGSGVHVMPITKSGVELRFAGSRPEVAVPGAKASGPLLVLGDRVSAAQEKNTSRYFALHTPKSALKLKQWFGSMTPDGLGAYLADQARPRQVRLVMDGGTVLVVFSAPRGADGKSSVRDMRYDYLVRQAGGFKIANMLYSSFFDDLLKGTPAVAAFLEQGSPGK